MRGRQEPAESRWRSRYVVQPNGCWEWLGATNEKGYGTFNPEPQIKVYAHRFGYELHHGAIPEGRELDHRCHSAHPTCPGGPCLHRRCVNPAHLEPVTHRENLKRTKRSATEGCPGDPASQRTQTPALSLG